MQKNSTSTVLRSTGRRRSHRTTELHLLRYLRIRRDWDEIDDSREWKGYIYFHQQDAESLAESGGTYVGFGSFLAYPRDEEKWNTLSDAQKEEIGALHEKLSVQLLQETVIPVLEKHGLSVKWNGNYNTRPYIDGVEVYNIP